MPVINCLSATSAKKLLDSRWAAWDVDAHTIASSLFLMLLDTRRTTAVTQTFQEENYNIYQLVWSGADANADGSARSKLPDGGKRDIRQDSSTET